MLQYIHATDSEFHQLEQRCKLGCVQSKNQLMPPGCQPARARVGFERVQHSTAYYLLVERGVTYSGQNAVIVDWFRRAKLEFSSFADLKSWIRNDLASEYSDFDLPSGRELQQADAHRPHHFNVDPAELTDLEELPILGDRSRNVAFLSARDLQERLCRKVRGQEDAIGIISRRACLHLARVRPRRPATMMLIGPTGVGKTKTSEALPIEIQEMTGRALQCGYVRLDMNVSVASAACPA